MPRPRLEVADIFRAHGAAWREANAGHISLEQLKVMSAIERCRSAALGGHVTRCEACAHIEIAYNSCRNRHCPKCQGALAKQWLAARQAELLPLAYFHVVFTVPTAIGESAYQNKALVYDLLFKAAAETLLTIGADPKHLGARLGLTAVLHTWGSAMTHHPHIHCIVPGGGLSLNGTHWVGSRPNFILPVKVLSRRFRRVFLEQLDALYGAGRLAFFGHLHHLHEPCAFEQLIAPLRDLDWYVDARAPFAGPAAVLEYLSRYTHRVAIANSRLISFDEHRVTFKWKDYRAKAENRYKTMSLETPEFIRRFLIHVLPPGFHRIRYYGLFANGQRAENLAKARELLAVKPTQAANDAADDPAPPDWLVCPTCGATMRIIEVFRPGHVPPAPPHRGGDPP
ncbi:MAG: IS91 family transposase [Gammaproteobacteria bacterium]|nr:IS91 family transposase [Gammaproteobacteria bacterium]